MKYDDIYHFYLFKDLETAKPFILKNIAKNLTVSDIANNTLLTDVFTYSPHTGSFFFRDDEFKDRHNLTEHIVVLSREHFSQSWLVQKQFGWSIDLNCGILN